MPRRLFLVAALALAGCPTPPSGQYLTKPFFQVSTDNSLCLQLYAVDGHSQGWQEQECGIATTNPTSTYLPTKTLTPAQLMQVQAAFAALPMPPDPSCTGAYTSNNVTTKFREATATTDVIWTGCVAANKTDLVEPYKTALNTLRGFVQAP